MWARVYWSSASSLDDTEECAAKFESFTQAHDSSLESTSVMDIAARNQGAYRPEYVTARRVQEQAKIARRQGRQVLLLDTAMPHLHWPSEMVDSGHATVVSDPAPSSSGFLELGRSRFWACRW